MTNLRVGVLDACFVIDWSRYRRRDLLAHLFDTVLIHEEVLGQLRSEPALQFLTGLLTRGFCRIYPWAQSDEGEFERLRDELASDSRIPELERPDILCLMMARRMNAVLLTENVGIIRLTQFHPRYSHVRVWTAVEVLESLVYRGALGVGSVEEFLEYVREYERDTKHIFREERINRAAERVGSWLRGRY